MYPLATLNLCRHGVDKDPPDLKKVNASQEIVTFSYTMEMLFKAMRSANAAFYAGALEAAYLVLVDALRLFKRLDNKKAIGIAYANQLNIIIVECDFFNDINHPMHKTTFPYCIKRPRLLC